MGAWGTELYENDTASDIREDYIDKLKRGLSNEDATKQLIEENKELLSDREDGPLFWLALSDTQWDYGRLLPLVKEKTMEILSTCYDENRWIDAGEIALEHWQQTLEKLKKKLDSPQSTEKKISKYRLYRCEWSFGDVFAYRFSGEFSQSVDFLGKYIAFRKVSEDVWWPGHIVPVVQIYNWIGNEVPSLKFLEKLPILGKKNNLDKAQKTNEYVIKLLSTSKKIIPINNLVFLGNIQGTDFISFQGNNHYTGYTDVGWDGSKWNNQFEEYVLKWYFSWNNLDENLACKIHKPNF